MKRESTGNKILAVLTDTQVAELLDIVFSAPNSKEVDRVLGRVSPDVKKTLSRLLSGTSSGEMVSAEKNREKWNNLWSQWEDVVSEIGDEEGKYVCQEAHWEPPYFDGSAVAEDLEAIAVKMLPLIEEISAAGTEGEGIFLQAVEDIEHNIKSYPEWMGADNEGIGLGPDATRCLLKWEWLAAGSVEIFLDRLITWQRRLKLVALGEDSLIKFFTSLSENTQREAFAYITARRSQPVWNKELSSSGSRWHKLYHTLAKKFDQRVFLEDCRSLLMENWRYGLPLVEELLKKGQDKPAEEIIAQTILSFIGQKGKEKWQPEKSLLINVLHYSYGSPETEIVRLLEEWAAVNARLQRQDMAMSLKLQLAAYRQPYQWDVIAQVFGEVNHPPFQPIANKLIGQWVEFIVTRTLGPSFEEDKKMPGCWINWLLWTGLDKTWDNALFYQKVKQWLKQLEDNQPARRQIKALYLLTRDLLEMYGLKKQYPNLYQIASGETRSSGYDTASRQNWLRKMQGDQMVSLLIEFWQKEMEKFIPDPSATEKSAYNTHAQWLAAANEVSQTIYNKVVSKWKIDHKKRTNLWKAIRERGLPA